MMGGLSSLQGAHSACAPTATLAILSILLVGRKQ
jgi:hypothetical protein